MAGATATDCCETGEALRRLLADAPVAIVNVRALAVASMFPAELATAVDRLPYDAARVVAPPEAAAAVGVTRPRMGEVLVFSRATLVGRLPDSASCDAAKLLGLLRAALSPRVADWDEDVADPFAVIGVPVTATFEEAHRAWRRRLAEYHPDRFAWAGPKIREVAAEESRRLNAALAAIERLRAR